MTAISCFASSDAACDGAFARLAAIILSNYHFSVHLLAIIEETAMLQGQLKRIDREMARLAALRSSSQRSRAARTWEYRVGRPGLPTVSVHCEYGRRGDLQQFLADMLRNAASVQLSPAQLAETALSRLGLAMSWDGQDGCLSATIKKRLPDGVKLSAERDFMRGEALLPSFTSHIALRLQLGGVLGTNGRDVVS